MLKHSFVLIIAFFLVLFMAISAPRAHAQILYGSMVGTVTDPSNAAVPGAKVEIRNEGTGDTRLATSSSSGDYSFPTLAVGTYDVTVTKQGFKTYVFKGASVGTDRTARVNVSLKLGAVAQTVEVQASTPQLQTDSAQVNHEISSTALTNIPVPFDSNFESLLITVPGISPPDNAHSYAANPSRAMNFFTNGATDNSNSVRIDGASASNPWLTSLISYVPSRHAIQSVDVVTNTFDVSQGIAGGAAVNVHIKTGTNQVHGSLYETNANNGVMADPFAFRPPPPGWQRPKFINNDFGGTIGGPVIKDKLFYFGSVEQSMLREGADKYVTVPTPAMRAGDFSDSPTPIYDPATGDSTGAGRTQFVASADPSSPDYNPACTNAAGCPNIIPTNRLDATALKIQKLLLPPPNEPGLTANYFASGPFHADRRTIDAKVDWNATQKLRLNGRLGLLHTTLLDNPIFGNNGGPVSGTGGRTKDGIGNAYDVTLGGNYLARPNFVIDGFFAINFLKTSSIPADSNVNQGLTTLNLPGTNGPTADYGGWPAFSISHYTQLGSAGGSSDLVRNDYHTYMWSGDASWVKGPHTIKFGGQVARIGINKFEDANATGTFSFNGGVTTLNATGAPGSNQFNSYASFLLGLPSAVSHGIIPFNNGRKVLHHWQYSAYAQDKWQVSRRLTLDYGVAWNYFPIPTRDNGLGIERYDPATNKVEICGLGGTPIDCGYYASKKDFSPSLGIAYRVTPTFVVRAGGGITYDPEGSLVFRNMVGNYPEILSLSVNAPSSRTAEGTLAAGIPAITVPDMSSGYIPLLPGYSVTSLDPHLRRDYLESWNFTLEKMLPGRWVAQAGYVADRQVKVNQVINLNTAPLGLGNAGKPYNILYGTTALIGWTTNSGHNHYDSLQASLSHRFAQGYLFQASYTWSKTLLDSYGPYAAGNGGYPAIPLPQYSNLNRALAPWDRPQDFTVALVADLPFGPGKRWLKGGGLVPKLAEGWRTNALFSFYSNTPFNVTSSGSSCNCAGSQQRADLIGSGPVAILGGIGPGQEYFDTSRFAPVTDVRFGTAGYDILRGPSAADLDFSLFRRFQLTERFNLEFQAEALNLTNTPHFGNPNGGASNTAAFGQISGQSIIGREGIGQRYFQFGLQLNF